MITPGQYREMTGKTAANLEARIDAMIRGAAEHEDRRATLGTVGIPSQGVDAVVAKYIAAGWDMEFIADERDGDFISVLLP